MAGQTGATGQTEPDYYALLGVDPTATAEEMRRAYGARAQAAQGDQAVFATLMAAWEELKDPAKRAAYDRRRLTAPPVSTAGGREAARMDSTRATVMPASGGAMTVYTPPPVQTTADPNTTQAFSLGPCPVCSTPGVPGEEFCLECGLMVGSSVGAQVQARPLPKLTETASGREWVLRTGDSIVGREGTDVMLPDKSVSRRHARLTVENGGAVYVEDTGSTNGTKLQGTRLEMGKRVRISDGTVVTFGSVEVRASVPPVEKEPEMLALPAPNQTAQPAPLALSAPEGTKNSAARLVGAGETHTLAATRTTFGRRPVNDVVLTGDTFVSGAHAAIVYESGKFKLVDLGSTNGTKLNAQRIIPNIALPLKDGDEVVFGQTAFTFREAGKG